MSIAVRILGRSPAYRLLGGGLVLGAAITMAACGSSSSSTASGSGSASSAPAGASSSTQTVTISAKSVPGVGTVLVNGQGRTLYLLSSEKGGKLTCTDDNGCTKVWPDTELPKGMTAATAGSGVQAALLGTVKDASGARYVTYHGWPLDTFSGDAGPGRHTARASPASAAPGTPDDVLQSGDGTAASSPSSGAGGTELWRRR